MSFSVFYSFCCFLIDEVSNVCNLETIVYVIIDPKLTKFEQFGRAQSY